MNHFHIFLLIMSINAFSAEKEKVELSPFVSFDENIKVLCSHAKKGQNDCKDSVKCDAKEMEKNQRFLKEFCNTPSKDK